MLPLRRAFVLAALLGAASACVTEPPDLPEADTLAATDDGRDLPDPDSGGAWASTGAEDESGSDESGGVPLPPVDPPDVGEGCDTFAQDCPAGEKCVPVGEGAGDGWTTTACRPVAMDPAQVGDPCTSEGAPDDGHDSCDVGSMCWNVDPSTGVGSCISLCAGSEADPICDDPDTACVSDGSEALAACLPMCFPSDDDCGPGQGCYLVGELFACVPVTSDGGAAAGEACEAANGCVPGTICINADLVPGCDGIGCCASYCDPTVAGSCGAETICTSLFGGMAPPDVTDVGVCISQ